MTFSASWSSSRDLKVPFFYLLKAWSTRTKTFKQWDATLMSTNLFKKISSVCFFWSNFSALDKGVESLIFPDSYSWLLLDNFLLSSADNFLKIAFSYDSPDIYDSGPKMPAKISLKLFLLLLSLSSSYFGVFFLNFSQLDNKGITI
jgi:hypothetical protein